MKKRTKIIIFLVFLFFSILNISVSRGTINATQTIDDWPMFGHDPAHTFASNEVVEPPLESLWIYNNINGSIYNMAVSAGVVYLGSFDGLYALDANTGMLKWKYKTNMSVSDLVVSEGVVYVGSNDGYVNALDALDANTGLLKWKSGVSSSRVNDFRSIIPLSGVIIGIGNNDIKAFDVNTRNQKWRYGLRGPYITYPAVYKGVVYVGSATVNDFNAVALDANTGSLKWEYWTQSLDTSVSSPAVSDGVVYFSALNNNVIALDANTGSLKWYYESIVHRNKNSRGSHPVVSNGIVYVGVSGSKSNSGYEDTYDNYFDLSALDANTGMLKWKYETNNSISDLAVSGSTVYFGSFDDYVYALDANTGMLKWKYKTNQSVHNIAVSVGVVYFGSDNIIYAFEKGKGTPVPQKALKLTYAPTRTATVKGTWNFDLDSGTEGDDSKADFGWAQATTTLRYLYPQNGASFAKMGIINFETVDCGSANYSSKVINGSIDNNEIPTGTVICAKTNLARYAKFRIDSYGYNLAISWAYQLDGTSNYTPLRSSLPTKNYNSYNDSNYYILTILILFCSALIIGMYLLRKVRSNEPSQPASGVESSSQYQQHTQDYWTYMQTVQQPSGTINSPISTPSFPSSESLSSASTAQIKIGKYNRELMCHACRGRNNINLECPNCNNYYCSHCAPDLNNRCMECNIGLNRIISSTQPIKSRGRYDCYVCKNGFDSGFKCPKCSKNYCQNCGAEAEENCLNCSSMLERLT